MASWAQDILVQPETCLKYRIYFISLPLQKNKEEQGLEAVQMKFLRHLLGITKLDKEKKSMY